MLGLGVSLWQRGKAPAPAIIIDPPAPSVEPIFHLDMSDDTRLFADVSGMQPAADGGAVARIDSQNGNLFAQQATASKRPVYVQATQSLAFDRTDDAMSIDIGSARSGRLLLATEQVVLDAKVNIPAQDWVFTSQGAKMMPGGLRAVQVFDAQYDSADLISARASMAALSANAPQGNVASLFQGRSDIVELDLSYWDTGAVTAITKFARDCPNLEVLDISGWDLSRTNNASHFARNAGALRELHAANANMSKVKFFNSFVRDCPNLEVLDMTGWDLSKVQYFSYFARNCTSLQNIIMDPGGAQFANCPATNYTRAFTNTNLSQSCIDNILTGIAAANTSNGTFQQSGGAAPSAAGQSAIDALRGRGWTVQVTGGY